ncbi:putative lysosomal cobalamin transporter [Rhizophagus clarus]|uniref:Probable lysosomal cobalamin transporter n=1 Tax=Rhizophagus clarus TaxID=94130 RepID=A0A8H3KYA0_9GLOM|nr:putative lysosomal cobalamin transporter [Rhizophagus clarus]
MQNQHWRHFCAAISYKMAVLVFGAWATYIIICVVLFVFSIVFTNYYQDKHDSERLATVVAICSLALCLSTVALFPVDIFLVSSTVDLHTGLKHEWATKEVVEGIVHNLKFVYYGSYGLIAIFCAFIIPFAYFYFEELEEEQTNSQRVMAALKYTGFFVAFILICLLFGFILRPSETAVPIDLDFFKKLLSSSLGENSISFVISILMVLGMVVFICYTAPGLSFLPIGMIKGTNKVSSVSNAELSSLLKVNREKQRIINAKYSDPTKTMSRKDARQFEILRNEEKVLLRQLRLATESRSKIWNRIMFILRPFELIIGFMLTILTVVIFASIFLTCIDKVKNSICGKECGYIINHPDIFNPLNFIFLKASKYFPIDYFFMVLLILYFFISTVYGVISIGIRFFWVHLYRFRKNSTPPQGLLFGAILFMLSLLALNYTLTMVVVPQYAQFGSQKYCNHTINEDRNCTEYPQLIVPCDVTAPTDICTPTVISTFIHRITLNAPFFGVIFYYAHWGFLGVTLLGFMYAMIRSPNNALYDDLDDEIDEEEQRLLANSGRRSRVAIGIDD